MKTKYLILLVVVMFVASCSTMNQTSLSHKNIHIPENSVASDRLALARDMINGVNQFMLRHFDCSDWILKNVSESNAIGQLVFTHEGQLYRGEVSELWSVQRCGENHALRLSITPDIQGSIIRIVAL